MEKTTINVEQIYEFKNFNDWLNHAAVRLGQFRTRGEVIFCVDSQGNLCHLGSDFMKARDKGRFPVTAFLPVRSNEA